MEHRHHRHDDVVGGEAEGVGHDRHHRVQHVRAVAVEDALGVAGRARRVAHPRRRVLVDGHPVEVAVGLGKPFLVGDDVGQRRVRQMSRIGEHDDLLQGLQRRRQLLDQRQEGQVHEERPVLGVVDDPRDLLGKQARIDGVVDGARAVDAVPDLEVTRGVPGKCGDPVADAVPVAFEPLGDPEGPAADLAICRPHDRPLDRTRDDFPATVLLRRVVEDLVTEQWPLLHQAAHRISSHVFCTTFRPAPALVQTKRARGPSRFPRGCRDDCGTSRAARMYDASRPT